MGVFRCDRAQWKASLSAGDTVASSRSDGRFLAVGRRTTRMSHISRARLGLARGHADRRRIFPAKRLATAIGMRSALFDTEAGEAERSGARRVRRPAGIDRGPLRRRGGAADLERRLPSLARRDHRCAAAADLRRARSTSAPMRTCSSSKDLQPRTGLAAGKLDTPLVEIRESGMRLRVDVGAGAQDRLLSRPARQPRCRSARLPQDGTCSTASATRAGSRCTRWPTARRR